MSDVVEELAKLRATCERYGDKLLLLSVALASKSFETEDPLTSEWVPDPERRELDVIHYDFLNWYRKGDYLYMPGDDGLRRTPLSQILYVTVYYPEVIAYHFRGPAIKGQANGVGLLGDETLIPNFLEDISARLPCKQETRKRR